MQSANHQQLKPLARPAMGAVYVVQLVFLCYFLAGASNGRLVLPDKDTPVILSGASAWLACLDPLFFLLAAAVRYDPAVHLDDGLKIKLVLVFVGIAVGAYMLAFRWAVPMPA